jgi:cephalosporin hydroxylase
MMPSLIMAVLFMAAAAWIKMSEEKKVFYSSMKKIFFLLSLITLIALMPVLLISLAVKHSDQAAIKRFDKIYYNPKYYTTKFLGITSVQYPTDNWVMQEIISEVRPDFIIETGTFRGGTSLFYAVILEKVNKDGKVITVDITKPDPRVYEFDTWNERVLFIQGNSVSKKVIDRIEELVKNSKVLVTLDSLHSKRHVRKELELYSPFVSLNSYIIVQDTHLGGHPDDHYSGSPGDGPWAAVTEFLDENKNFIIDPGKEKYLLTQNPSGFLKRVK